MRQSKAQRTINPDIELKDVKHSALGRSIEDLESELPALEAIYNGLDDHRSKLAVSIRSVLEACDYLLDQYQQVSGY